MEKVVYKLSNSEKQTIQVTVGKRLVNPYTLAYSENPRIEVDHSLPVLHELICDFVKSNKEILIIKNCPTGEIGRTPTEDKEIITKPDLVSEKFLLAVGFSLGTPFAIDKENSGYLVHNIYPVEELANIQCAQSSTVFLTVHTEWSCFTYPPDYVALLCLRESGENVATPVISFERILALLTPEETEIMKTKSFITEIDMSLRDSKTEGYSKPFALYRGEKKWQHDTEYTHGIDEKSERVIQKIAKILPSLYEDVILKTGDLLIINNNRVSHARKTYHPRFDGTDRWLQRMNVYIGNVKRTMYTLDELLLEQ